jgi:hypothetical protein
MWPEPLAAATAPLNPHEVTVTVRDAEGRAVAAVRCAHNARDGFATFGEMRLLADAGGPRQRLRALVLLVREAMRYGADIGITHARTEAPARMAAFAARLSGVPGVPVAGRRVVAAELQAMRTALLRETDADGNFTRATEREVAEFDAAIDLPR